MINLQQVSLHYQTGNTVIHALAEINLHLPAGQFTVIVGKSGCGKSTLLKVLAGLQPVSQGMIQRSSQAYHSGMIFQEPRLLPWLNVEKNITLGLEGKYGKAQIADKLENILQLIGLSDFRHAWPGQLSGGMMQRVALARTLITEPDFLLMDEPFSALDALTRRILQNELISLWQALNNTIVFVTHDVEEAILLGQKIILMKQGKIDKQIDITQAYPRKHDDLQLINYKQALLEDLLQSHSV